MCCCVSQVNECVSSGKIEASVMNLGSVMKKGRNAVRMPLNILKFDSGSPRRLQVESITNLTFHTPTLSRLQPHFTSTSTLLDAQLGLLDAEGWQP